MQNALAKLYVAWPRASRADSVDAYVRRVIINSHLDETRRPWRRESPTEDERLDRAAPAGVAPEDADALWTRAEGSRPQAAPRRGAAPLLGALRRGDGRRPRRQPRHRQEPDLGRPRTAPDDPPSGHEPPRRTAMTDPADRFLEGEAARAGPRGRRSRRADRGRRTPGRRRLRRMRVAMAGATTRPWRSCSITSLTAGDPKATEPRHATDHRAPCPRRPTARRPPTAARTRSPATEAPGSRVGTRTATTWPVTPTAGTRTTATPPRAPRTARTARAPAGPRAQTEPQGAR